MAKSIVDVESAIKDGSEGIQKVSDSAGSLSAAAKELREMVAYFKV